MHWRQSQQSTSLPITITNSFSFKFGGSRDFCCVTFYNFFIFSSTLHSGKLSHFIISLMKYWNVDVVSFSTFVQSSVLPGWAVAPPPSRFHPEISRSNSYVVSLFLWIKMNINGALPINIFWKRVSETGKINLYPTKTCCLDISQSIKSNLKWAIKNGVIISMYLWQRRLDELRVGSMREKKLSVVLPLVFEIN